MFESRSILRTLLLSVCVISGSSIVRAQAQDAGLKVVNSPTTNRATFLSAADGGAIPIGAGARQALTPLDVLVVHGKAFGITNPNQQLRQQKIDLDQLGETHTTFEQIHNGVEVFSGVIKVHQDAAGAFRVINGDFYDISPKLSTVPTINLAAADAAARLELVGINPITTRNDLLIVDPGWYGDPSIGPHLAYYVVLADSLNGIREAFFIDAHTAEIIDQWSMVHTARDRAIYDGNGGAGLPGSLARAEGDGPVGSPADVDRAYDYFGDTYDYFFRAFGRDSIDDAGTTLVATINSTAPPCPNAFWNGVQMVFCTGTVTDDIVGHELAHGVTEFTANLIYQNQSGQLNESYSDVFGEMIDLFNGDAAFVGTPGGTAWPTHPTGPGQDTPNNLRTVCSPALSYPDGVRWLMGEDATAFGGAIRDMWNPPCEGDPDTANSPLQTCNSSDSGGVHSGSGIPNHAFAILTDGKNFNGQNVSGIGPIKSGAIWYRALSVYLTPASDFEDAYLALNQSAADLVGTFPNDPRTGNPSGSMFTVADANELDKALLAVELNTPGACGEGVNILISESPLECPQRTSLFADAFEGGTNGWTVSNSNPPTAYDWVQTAGLPLGRPGTGWFVADPNIGDCAGNDETSSQSLFSPTVNLPAGSLFPTLAFTHFVATEGGWDGGNISIRVNGGSWQSVPRTAFKYSPYNMRLNSAAAGNTNPFAGQDAWTGAGGGWGRSIVDLSGFASGGDSVQCRFDFGKDGCAGVGGWYVDDFEIYDCPDCDSNSVADDQDFVYTDSSASLGNIGTGSSQTFTLVSPPQASGNVLLTFLSLGDFSISSELVDVDINGTSVGSVFGTGGNDCSTIANFGEISVSAATFNAAVGGGNASINMVATSAVNPTLCSGESYISVFVEYALNANDANSNGILDECEGCTTNGDCDDGLFCNGAETCDAGNCLLGTPPTLDDGIPCTVDACDEVNDVVTHTANDSACDNGLFCDGAESCDVGTGCLAGTPPLLDDGVPCTIDACNEGTDMVTHTPDDSACDNGLFCDGAESCDVGSGCLAGTPPTVDDGIPCTTDACDEVNDVVTHLPDDGACDNGLFCDGAESCDVGSGCLVGTPPTLDDGIPCTTDACDEVNDVVTHLPDDGACDNGLFCDGSETCDEFSGCQVGTDPCTGFEVCEEDGDLCSADCNTNSLPDDQDISGGFSLDCNANAVPDECDTVGGGDFTADGLVALDDLAAFDDCLAGPGLLPAPALPGCVSLCLDAFDGNGDSDVDLSDYAQFQAAFFGP